MTEIGELTTQAEQRWVDGLEAGPRVAAIGATGVGPGDQAPDVELADSDGSSVSLSQFWAERPTLFIFWRHFGCGCGADRAERLAAERQSIADEGGQVVVIGMGDQVRSANYRVQYGLTEPLLSDHERRAYQAFGVPEGTMLAVTYDDADVLLGGPPAWRMVMDFKRSKDMHLVDDGWQLMSEFVVRTDGVIQSAYRYQYCDNFPDPRFALSAIKEANAGLDPLRGSTVAPE